MGGEGYGQQGRLLILSELELIFGTLKAESRKRKAEGFVGLLKDAGSFGERIG
jgi:hypothetical protein